MKATIKADAAAISGSIDSVAYMYMRTGRVTVEGAVTKIDMVTSSKLLMKANSQPPVTPGSIIGRVTRRNTVKLLAPNDSAACSQLASDVVLQKTIDEADVVAYQLGRVESTGFDVADAALEGNTPIALINLRNALLTGTDPVLIVSALASSFRTLAKVSGASRSVKSFELAQSLAIAPWQIDKARRQLVGWSDNAMAKAVIAISAADADIKGAAADPIYALERAIMTVCTAKGSR